jgi:hypothetical protein
MSKIARKVNFKLLKRTIIEVESDGPLINRQTLYKAVATQYNNVLRNIKMGDSVQKDMVDDIFPEITHSIVQLRIKDGNIKVKTPIGKRGRPKGQKIVRADGKPVERISRAAKFASSPDIVKSLEAIRKTLKDKPHWADKIENGSMLTAIKAFCWICSGWDTVESKNCNLIECSLHPFLPRKYQD